MNADESRRYRCNPSSPFAASIPTLAAIDTASASEPTFSFCMMVCRCAFTEGADCAFSLPRREARDRQKTLG
jgi:hypothetical protein